MRKLSLKSTNNPTDFSYRQYFCDDQKNLYCYCVEPNEAGVNILWAASPSGEPSHPVPFGLTVFVDGEIKWDTQIHGILDPAEVNLRHVCDGEYELTEEDRDNLMRVLGKGLRQKRRDKLRARLKYAHLQASCPFFERLSKRVDIGLWELCARQDYNYDLKVLRDVFIDNR